jgi:hypothetical protein
VDSRDISSFQEREPRPAALLVRAGSRFSEEMQRDTSLA